MKMEHAVKVTNVIWATTKTSKFSILNPIKFSSAQMHKTVEINIVRIIMGCRTREFLSANFSYICLEIGKVVSANQTPTWAYMKISYLKLKNKVSRAKDLNNH